jgi:hypothetical protein
MDEAVIETVSPVIKAAAASEIRASAARDIRRFYSTQMIGWRSA